MMYLYKQLINLHELVRGKSDFSSIKELALVIREKNDKLIVEYTKQSDAKFGKYGFRADVVNRLIVIREGTKEFIEKAESPFDYTKHEITAKILLATLKAAARFAKVNLDGD